MNTDFTPIHPEQVLDALAAPGTTLATVAIQFNTSTTALARWLASPETAQLAADLEAAAALQIRLRASRSLHLALNAVERVLSEPSTPSASLRAAALLLRLSTLQQPRGDRAKPRHPPAQSSIHLSVHDEPAKRHVLRADPYIADFPPDPAPGNVMLPAPSPPSRANPHSGFT